MDRSDPMFWIIAGLAILVAILVLRDAWQQGLWRDGGDRSKEGRERKKDERKESPRKQP